MTSPLRLERRKPRALMPFLIFASVASFVAGYALGGITGCIARWMG